ncbi:DHH family phosphoesterase [Candidatus Dojkabacteria bacterium]|uniref:DHH family phosphoesterase n=1 Tax=Candidatus Dojkabacteria bacterium TaxID=2099670 RepID=A0A955L0J9_9BACT|nr:DHH family phosphoesterase [Candidatus Dojkabacteria bacterium]
MTKKEFKEQFTKLARDADRIVITTHVRPDGDAISSALSMQMYLQGHLGLKSEVIITGAKTDIWDKWDTDGVIQWVPDALKVCAGADLVIMLDGGEYKRFGYDEEEFATSSAKKICIDHHPDAPDDFDLVWKDDTAVAAAQLVFELLYKDEKVSAAESEMLVLGILSDTAILRYISPNRARVLGEVEELVRIGNIDIQLLATEIEQISAEEFEIAGECMQNADNVLLDGLPGFTYTYMSCDFYKKYDPETGKRGTLIFMLHFLRKITGYGWGFVVRPVTEKEFSLSFRALPGTVDCQKIAQAFNGGGHKLAAGGEYKTDQKTSAEEICRLVIEKLGEIKQEITVK